MLSMTQPQANEFFYAELFSATSIIAALLAREVAMWTGGVLARRGRALKVRNADAHAAYEKEQGAGVCVVHDILITQQANEPPRPDY